MAFDAQRERARIAAAVHKRTRSPFIRAALGVLIVFFTAGSLLGACTERRPEFTSKSGNEGNRKSTIRVVMDDNYPPYVFRDEEGRLQGILIDQWNLWEKRTGVKANLIGMDWAKAQAFMEAGKADVIDTVFITPRRQEIYDFSAPYTNIDVPIFYHQDISGIVNIKDMRGFTVGVKEGDSCVDMLQEGGLQDLKPYASYHAIIRGAMDGEIKVFCLDEPPALYLLNKNHLENEYHKAFTLYSGQFHRAVRKGNASTLALVEDGFRAIKKEEYQAIDGKWMGTPLVSAQVLTIGFYSLIGAGLFGLFLLLWNFSLQESVQRKTAALSAALTRIKESEERFRLSFMAVPNAVSINRVDSGEYADVNEGFTRLFGYTREEVIGRNSYDLNIWADIDDRRRLIEEVQRNEAVENFEARYRRKDGKIITTFTSSRFIAYAGVPHIISVIKDIEEMKQAEQALRSQHTLALALSKAQSLEETFSLCLDTILEQTCMDAGMIYLFDDASGQMTLIVHRNMPEETVRRGAIIAGDTIFSRIVREGKPIYRRINEMSTENRNLHIGSRSLAAVPVVHNGKVIACLNLASFSMDEIPLQDRTSLETTAAQVANFIVRSQAEEEITRLNDELEKRVRERTLQLQTTNQELEAFSYSVSHDLRAPLRSIDGFSQVLLDDYSPSLDEAGKRSLQRIRSAAQRMSSLIDSLLELARITRSPMRLTTLDLSDMAAGIVEELRRETPERRVSVAIQPELHIEADERLMELVLVNLLGNAWKFTSRKDEAEIEFGAVDDENGRRVYFVRDNGAGFDMAYVEKLFGAFQRLHTEREFPGTGIGLATVKRIIQRHGGRIWVESEVRQGSTFYFTLHEISAD